MSPTVTIYHEDNLNVLSRLDSGSIDLVYIDPPFNTGKSQSRTHVRTVRDAAGDRIGFKGERYHTERIGTSSFADSFDDYLAFLEPRFVETLRVLQPDGSFFFHVDYREVHYCKVMLDSIFGRSSFMNEIIWAYDYGGRSKSRWSAKHDNILWYAKDPKNYKFNFDEMDRIPYMAPGLVTPEKAERGKTPTDVWWHTIVSPTGREKTGWPTQKPLGIIDRIIKVHSRPGDTVLDYFAGSGTTGVSAINNGRNAILVDSDENAVGIMRERLALLEPSNK